MDRYLAYFIALGLFWGLSPSLYRAMAEAAVPVTHIMVYSGLAVGLALFVIARLMDGRVNLSIPVLRYGLGCAALMNVPFGAGLFFARHVPTTELALIMSTAPFFNYAVALLTRRENASPRRLLAVAVGFLSSAVLILSREGTLSGEVSWWTLAAFTGPIMYTAYNWYASRGWPTGASTMSVGAAESIWSGLTVLPFFLAFEPPWAEGTPLLHGYWAVLAASAMWIVERIAFFTLIRDKGPLFTIQAIYLATPASVIFAALFYGGGSDLWIWVSLAILMGALWLNNSGSSRLRPA